MVFNGHVDSLDEATGHAVHPCLVTLRTTKGVFQQIDLSRVDPELCLKGLNASVSKKPTELAPVRPVLEFNMVDPRFVEEQDIISGLDDRTNLMDLNPREFESLITNLFEKMGLETRQTRPSRDGGVHYVSVDPRPIFGGKVVIQAKRYKNTVALARCEICLELFKMKVHPKASWLPPVVSVERHSSSLNTSLWSCSTGVIFCICSLSMPASKRKSKCLTIGGIRVRC